MSAFTTNPTHLAAIAATASTLTARRAFASVMARTNVASVNRRYNDSEPAEVVSDELIAHFHTNPVGDVQLLKAIHCQAYQSSDHPAWADSPVATLLAALEQTVRARLGIDADVDPFDTHLRDAYEAAQWEVRPIELLPTPAPQSTGAALADAILAGNGSAAMAQSHRGQMKAAIVALGLRTASEARRLKRPECEAVLAAEIARAAA